MRITFFTILGLCGLAAGVLFFPPLREKADLVLFNAASASGGASQDAPSPLENAADTTCDALKSLLGKECDEGDDDADQRAAANDETV